MAHPEELLVSALLSSGEVLQAENLGLTESQFHEFRTEYEWIINYKIKHRTDPSVTIFRHAFPDFLVNEEVTGDLEYLVEQVKTNHARHQTAKMSRELLSGLKNNEDPLDLLSSFQSQAMRIVRGIDTSHVLPESLTEYQDSFEGVLFRQQAVDHVGAVFSHPTLQERTGGIYEGDLVIKAARLGQGKSWSLVDDSVANLLAGKKVLYFSLEMTRRQMEYRFQTSLAHRLGFTEITHSEIQRAKGLDLLAYKGLLEKISDKGVVPGSLFINDTTRGKVTPTTVAAAVNKYAPDVVVVDYITLLGSSTGGRTQEGWQVVADIVGELKEVATQFRVPILTAAQINREGDKGGWKPPRSVHLSQSDSLGQDADRIITMKRFGKGAMCYLLDKNRHGQDGDIWFSRFDPNNGDFEEISRETAEFIRETEGLLEEVD